MKFVKKLVLVLLIFVVVFSQMNTATYAKVPKVKKISMYIDNMKNIKVSGAKKKVKWKSSNKKVASIVRLNGDKNQTATILSGKKTGSCTIKAVVGKKVYKYKVKVKKNTAVSRATLVSITDSEITIKFSNSGKEDISYGNSFWFEKFENGKWNKLNVTDSLFWTMEAYIVKSGSATTKKYSLKYLKNKDGVIEKGKYRIHTDASYKKEEYKYVEFEIK